MPGFVLVLGVFGRFLDVVGPVRFATFNFDYKMIHGRRLRRSANLPPEMY